MTMKELKYFITLVNCKSFTRASEALFVTQPTITKALKSLERTYGEPLIFRNGRDISLTDAGKVIFEHAESVLLQLEAMEVKLRDLQQLKSGQITLGIPPMVGHIYTHLIQQFSQRYPNIEVLIVEGGSRKLELALIEGKLDIAITMYTQPDRRFHLLPIGSYPIYAVLAQAPQWKNRTEMDIDELKELPFYLYNSEFIISEVVTNLCIERGFQPKVGVRSSQWDFLASMVKSGKGVAFMPEPICQKLNADDYCFIPLKQTISWDLAVIWSQEHYVSKSSRAMLELIRSTLLSHAKNVTSCK